MCQWHSASGTVVLFGPAGVLALWEDFCGAPAKALLLVVFTFIISRCVCMGKYGLRCGPLTISLQRRHFAFGLGGLFVKTLVLVVCSI